MAITYTNVINDNVIDSLNTLLSDEFSIPVYYDEHKGNHSFLITPGEDTLLEYNTSGQSRSYAVQIEYQLKSGGDYARNNLKQVSEIMERMKRLIHNNSAYSPSDVYKWHDARTESLAYTRNEEDTSILNGTLEFSCTVTEVT